MSDKRDPLHDENDGDDEIKVTDRRKFDSDGRRREDVDEPEIADEPVTATPAGEAAGAAAPEPRPPAAKAAPSREADIAGGAGSAAAGSAPGEPGPPPDGAPQGVDFQQFAYFLYMSALHELGVPTQPGEPGRPPDLDRSRFFIDVLRVLQDKTKGNLDPGETKLLEEVLYNLQMQFLSISGQPAS